MKPAVRKGKPTKTQDVLQVLQQVEQMGKRHGLAPSTIRKKQRLIAKILSDLPVLSPDTLGSFLQTYQTVRGKHPLRASTKNSIRAEIRWLLTYIYPTTKTSAYQTVLKKEPTTTPGRKIRPAELDQLLTFAPTSLHALAYRLIGVGGFRPHELLSLKGDHVEQVNPGQVIVRVPAVNPKVSSKKNKTGARPVYLEGEVVEELTALSRHRKQTDEPYLFPWAPGTLSTTFCRMKQQYNEWCRTNNRPPFEGRLYDLRHSVATRLASEGMPEYLLRKMMGWTPSSTMPSVYIHLDEHDLANWFVTTE